MIVAFREERLIKQCINQFNEIADKVVVAVSTKPWRGSLKPDNTYKLAKSTFAKVKKGRWKTEADQRNWCMEKLSKMDYVLICDTDMFFERKELKKIKRMKLTERQYGCRMVTYWKNYYTSIYPRFPHNSFLIKSDCKFEQDNRIENYTHLPKLLPINCFHLSWVKTDKEVLEKITSYSHSHEIIDGWYENIWLKDVRVNFAPTVPTDYLKTKKYDLPKEILKCVS